MIRLPSSLDDLAGLRAARWTRESTAGQYDTFGPDAQHDLQGRAIERYGLADTGLAWQVSASGWKKAWTTPEWEAMVESARAGDFDVLVVGYASRFLRNLKQALIARDDVLHPLGVAVLFADERILSSDEDRWEYFVREATEAESYSRKLAKRVSEGYAARFRRLADPGGNAPLGFVRDPAPPHTLAVDPATIDRAVELFRRYATGNVSIEQLAGESGIPDEAIKMTLRNPIYNGWVTRHRRRGSGEQLPAAWRQDPPVSDDLWEQVQAVRASRVRAGNRSPRAGRVDHLSGLLYCTCGVRIRSDGRFGDGQHRRRHPRPCPAWGRPERLANKEWLDPLVAQVAGIRLDDATTARIVRALGEEPAIAVSIDRARQQRELRQLATDFAEGRLDAATFTTRAEALRERQDAPSAADPVAVPADRAIAWLGRLREAWELADDEQAKADLLHAIYQRVEVEGRRFVGVTLTPAAYRHGLALALPERVRCALARPEGNGHRNAHPTRAVTIPIIGRREWLRAARPAVRSA